MLMAFLFICMVTLLSGKVANTLKCYKYADDGDKMCVAYEDCTDKSEIVTCSDDEDTCGWGVRVSSNRIALMHLINFGIQYSRLIRILSKEIVR